MSSEAGQPAQTARIVVATTVALSFISFWRGAAIVLSDLASTMFYVGGISEQADRQVRAVVRPGRDVLQLCRPLHLSGELQHVRARGRLCGGARQHGALHGEAVGLRSRSGLRSYGTDQLGERRPVSGTPLERTGRVDAAGRPDSSERIRRLVWRGGDPLLLEVERQGHPRIQLQGAAHHAGDHRDGGDAPDLVPAHSALKRQG